MYNCTDDFKIDGRLLVGSIYLGKWPLSHVFLKDNADYSWCVLVPEVAEVQDIMQLSREKQHQLMDEIAALSSMVRDYFNPDKINVANLGNSVSQLHVHVVARFEHDKLWPHAIWQNKLTDSPYSDSAREKIVADLKPLVESYLYSSKGS